MSQAESSWVRALGSISHIRLEAGLPAREQRHVRGGGLGQGGEAASGRRGFTPAAAHLPNVPAETEPGRGKCQGEVHFISRPRKRAVSG